ERLETGGRVVGAGGVVLKGTRTIGRVVIGGVSAERITTGGCIVVAACVVRPNKRKSADGRVSAGGCDILECTRAGGRVGAACCEETERPGTLSRVVVGIASVRWWANSSSRGQNRKPCKGDEKNTEPQRSAVS